MKKFKSIKTNKKEKLNQRKSTELKTLTMSPVRIDEKSDMKFLFIVLIGGIKLDNWRPPSLSELTPYLIPLGLTHLGSEASI